VTNHLIDSMSQPDPTPNDLPASWDLVIEDVRARMLEGKGVIATMKDMRDRDRFGFQKYGVRIQPDNGRDSLVDAYQEALDLCVYLRSALYELQETGGLGADELREVYVSTLENTVSLRSFIFARDGK